MTSEVSDFEVRLAVVFTQLVDAAPLHDFYHRVLGLPIAKQVGTQWIEYGGKSLTPTSATNIGVHEADDMAKDDPPETILSFETKNLNALHAHLTANGVKCSGIIERDRGLFFLCADPAGNTLHFIEFNAQWRAQHSY